MIRPMSLVLVLIPVLAPAVAAQDPASDLKNTLMAESVDMGRRVAQCLGVDYEVYLDASNPTRGESRRPTKDELKRNMAALKIMGKIPRDRQQYCNTSVHSAKLDGLLGQVVQMAPNAKEKMDRAAAMTEAPGGTVAVAEDPAAELGRGKTALRGVDWVAAKGEVSSAGQAAFAEAVEKLATAMAQAGGRYRVDFYLDRRYDDATASQAAAARFETLKAALAKTTDGTGLNLELGRARRDGDPRIEIVRVK